MMTFIQQWFFPEGKPHSSTVMITQNVYKLCGELMAMSIVQGGQAPCMLSPVIFDYLTRDLKIENLQSSNYSEKVKSQDKAACLNFNIPLVMQYCLCADNVTQSSRIMF